MVRYLAWWFALVIFLISPAQSFAQGGEKTAHIGVLAFRGSEVAYAQWRHLAEYLTGSVDGWSFRIVPVTLTSAPEKIDAKEIDFLVTNPGHFVSLANDFQLSALATRERFAPRENGGLLTYGAVIFVRSGSGMTTIGDLRGKRLAAVSPDAFGGFQIAWDELRRQNIDPFTDLPGIRFMGFPQDAIVMSVAAGNADAGVVRSGLLESLHAEGRIDIKKFNVLNSAAQPGYPFRVTGHLYPEWPFLALAGIDKRLREDVAVALLSTQKNSIRQAYGLKDIWSAPLSYEGVRQLVTAYHSRKSSARSQPVWRQWSMAVIAAVAGIVLASLTTWLLLRSSRRPAALHRDGISPSKGEDGAELVEVREKFRHLTRRERQILAMICAGQTNKDIANNLSISPKTVEFHRANLIQKTSAGTTAHLIQLATRLHLDQGFVLGESSH